MKAHKVLHILRNPWGWTSDEIRTAQLEAADIIEKAAFPVMSEKELLQVKLGACCYCHQPTLVNISAPGLTCFQCKACNHVFITEHEGGKE